MSVRSRAPFRADHVGSLLRPQSLLDLRQRHRDGDVPAEALRRQEDECIRDVVAKQESIGLKGITDGEYRRESFHGDFIDKLEGVEFRLLPPDQRKSSSGPFVAFVTGKIGGPPGGIEVDNFRFLESVTTRTAKITLPSPTMTHFRGGREAIDESVYPDLTEFFADLARVYREEVARLSVAGCRYLQLDDTNLAYLCDERMRTGVVDRGEDPEQLALDYAALINASIAGRRDHMAVCIHLCRGNARSRWFARGGYEPVAEVLFNELDVDGYFLEYDDERSGDFSPLRHVPKGRTVVLGLVTSKRGELEDRESLKRRIDEASRYVDLAQLCLSPQCGFASAAGGNLLSEGDQWRKLELVVELADEVWGGD